MRGWIPFLAWGTAVILGSTVRASPAAAFCRMAVDRGQECCDPRSQTCIFLAWNRRCMEVALEFTGSASLPQATVKRIIETSFQSWTASPCGTPSFEVRLADVASRCDVPEFNGRAGNINSVAFIRRWTARDNDPRAFALTTVWHSPSTGEILDVDMEFNEEQRAFGICPAARGCQDGTVDLQNVMTHEAGHFFGIGHSPEVTATMFAESVPGETTRRTLTIDDTSALCEAYPDGALPADCTFDPIGGLAPECGGGGDGCSCRSSQRPHTATGELLLAMLVTGVLGRRRFFGAVRRSRWGARRLDRR